MPITQITDHAARAAAALIEQYKDKPRVVGLLTAFVNQVQDAEDGLFPTLFLPKLGPVNLAPDSSFESDSNGDGIADQWAAYNNSPGPEPVTPSRVAGRYGTWAQRIAWAVNNTSQKGVQTGSSVVGGGVAGGWKPGATNVIGIDVRASGTNVGQKMGTGGGANDSLNWNVSPATSKALLNPPLTTDWQRYAWLITWGASVETNGNLFVSIAAASGTQGTLDFDGVLVTDGPDLLDFQTTGANLDIIGRVVGEPRLGRNDLSYRTALQAKILLNLSSGTIEELYAIFALLLSVNGIAATMEIAEFYPKAFAMRLHGALPSVSMASDLFAVLKSAKDAGARGFLEYSLSTPGNTFTLDSGPGLDIGHLADVLPLG